MPSHFSSIGFPLSTKEFAELAQSLRRQAERISAGNASYLRWSGSGGEEVWLQLDATGHLIEMTPHFAGKSALRVGLQSVVHRANDTALDGAFHAWCNPTGDLLDDGDYPFVFDCPDFGSYVDIDIPSRAAVQVAAFAHEVTFHDSVEAYEASQERADLMFASQSFIPSGLFNPGGDDPDPPKATAIFTGHVRDAAERTNEVTAATFHWVLVDTLGGQFDVVLDPALVTTTPVHGGVLSGSFWLSGRLQSYARKKRRLFRKRGASTV